MNKRKLKTFIGTPIGFGDYILFQEYEDGNISKPYKISKPILAIYLGLFPCDQTIGFNYVKWNNDNHTKTYTTVDGKQYKDLEQAEMAEHIEWMDYIDILGHWTHKPSWREIIVAYRKQNTQEEINSDEIDWEN